MSYVRCYRCGVACPEGSFVRMDVRTWSGLRRSNVCHDCAVAYREQRERANQIKATGARQLLLLTVIGAIVLLTAVGSLIVWLLHR